MARSNAINSSQAMNYIIGNQVYILGDFEDEEMNEMIGELGNLVLKLPQMPKYNTSIKIESPYSIDDSQRPVIDFFIDSCGGYVHLLNDISTLINLAKYKGAIIRTTVLSSAYSCGSLLAIQGTPGYRIMAHDAQHLVHFGTNVVQVTTENEIPERTRHMREGKRTMLSKYKTHTKISDEELNKYKNCETGYINAKRCLRLEFCDWIIGENGELIGRKNKGRTK